MDYLCLLIRKAVAHQKWRITGVTEIQKLMASLFRTMHGHRNGLAVHTTDPTPKDDDIAVHIPYKRPAIVLRKQKTPATAV